MLAVGIGSIVESGDRRPRILGVFEEATFVLKHPLTLG